MKIISKKNRIIRRMACAVLLLLYIMIVIDNAVITTTYTRVPVNGLQDQFDDFRIVQISDLHNNLYGKDQSSLILKIREARPDIIVITGDLIDQTLTNVDNAMMFVREAVHIAPVFYVSGNHESSVPVQYEELISLMKKEGVTVLDNEAVQFFSGKDSITVAGIRDPEFDMYTPDADIADREIKEALSSVSGDQVTVLLSHRPELISVYERNGLDLVLTGHAHGGQVRLPFIGALFSPHQGFFPKYTSGIYQEGNTKMFVSRGLGNGMAPLRFNDGPELAVVILEKGTASK